MTKLLRVTSMRILIAIGFMAMSGCIVTVGSTNGSGGGLLDPGGGAPAVRQMNAIEDMSFATILNTYRATFNQQPVAFDARLNTAAQDYADVLAANLGHFSTADPHVGPDGSTTLQRMQAAGYNARTFAENLAGNQSSEQGALLAWRNSPSHNRNMLNQRLDGTFGTQHEDFGLGLAEGANNQTRWVLLLGTD
jgi:uncharacterized protein YkwD